MQSENINILWASLVVEELIRQQVTQFYISPGSRCTPLTIAVARHRCAQKKICYDERAAAFCALGYAQSTGKPAVVISTSATAVANYLPAVVEASQSSVPLLVLSADRPPELLDCGANQSIEQHKIFGGYVRWFCQFPCPSEEISWQFVLTTIDQAVYRSLRSPSGPVHLNFAFREPLAPHPQPYSKTYYSSNEKWSQSSQPFTRYQASTQTTDEKMLSQIAVTLRQATKGLCVVGRLGSYQAKEKIAKALFQLGWPIWADITSGLRSFSNLPLVHLDFLALSDHACSSYQPDIILHLGGPLTSKRVLQLLAKQQDCSYLWIENHPRRLDPSHCVTWRIEAKIESLLSQLQLPQKSLPEFSTHWWPQQSAWQEKIAPLIEQQQQINEIAVVDCLQKILPSPSGLFLASSMTIRYFDLYAWQLPPKIIVASNRGASGIDGTLASAIGFAQGLKQPVTLVIGDLALLHDLNSLTLLHKQQPAVQIILFNNYGGEIFSFLPIAQHPEVFQEYFTTPHHYHFAKVAENFDLAYCCPTSLEQFASIYQQQIANNQSTLYEIITPMENNVALHQQIQAVFSKEPI